MRYFLCLTFTTAANASPNITVEAVLNVTLGVESNLAVSAFDPDGDDVTVTMDSGPHGATFDGDVFKWIPTSMESVNISYVFCYLYSHNKLHWNVIDIRFFLNIRHMEFGRLLSQ